MIASTFTFHPGRREATGKAKAAHPSGPRNVPAVAPGLAGSRLACRRMADADIEPVIELLASGFPERSPDYWRCSLERLRLHPTPDGYPRYGWVMTAGQRPVGVILVIFSTTDAGDIRGNVSSWYVEPGYRAFSNMLLATPMRLTQATLFNISPAPSTIATIKAQGFTRCVEGTFISIPSIAPRTRDAQVHRIDASASTASDLLRDHAGWRCLSLEVVSGGRTHPFVFVKRHRVGRLLPCAQLVYCRDVEEFVRYAGTLGRYLLRHGIAAVLIDAAGPISGLVGTFRAGHSPKYYRGGSVPRLGDLSYTELAIFGS